MFWLGGGRGGYLLAPAYSKLTSQGILSRDNDDVDK